MHSARKAIPIVPYAQLGGPGYTNDWSFPTLTRLAKKPEAADKQGFTMSLRERMSGRDSNLTYKIEPRGWLCGVLEGDQIWNVLLGEGGMSFVSSF